jgi:IS30 family transposase
MANKKKHLREEERFCIERMLGQNESFGKIAKTLGRGISTISEEVKRNGGRERYSARKAEIKAYFRQYRKKKECNKVAMDPYLTRRVGKMLSQGLSPETIRDRLPLEAAKKTASAKSIRKFVDKRHGLERFLFWHRNHKKSGRKKGGGIFLQDPERKSIDVRPWTALYEYGHWEGDFIVSSHNSSILLVLTEKFTRTLRLAILPNRNNDLVNEAVVSLLKGFTVNSLTLDNDIAFAKWKTLEEMLGAPAYFCHPYHSWEKGLVENTNRWIRQFVPKKSDLALYSKEFIQEVENWFVHSPRQCLNGRTAYEMMMENEYQIFVSSLEINLPTLRIGG